MDVRQRLQRTLPQQSEGPRSEGEEEPAAPASTRTFGGVGEVRCPICGYGHDVREPCPSELAVKLQALADERKREIALLESVVRQQAIIQTALDSVTARLTRLRADLKLPVDTPARGQA